MSYTPKFLINLALLLAGILLAIDLIAISYPPYTGFRLEENQTTETIQVVRLDDWVAESGLQLGDSVLSIRNQSGTSLTMHPRYFQRNSFGARQHFSSRSERIKAYDEMYQLLSQDPVILRLDDGREIELEFSRARPLSSLSANSWAIILIGISIPLLSALVWAWKPNKPETVFLLLSGLGFYLINFTASASIYNLEMYFPPVFLHWLSRIMLDLGQLSFAAFGASVLLYYPNKFNFSDRVAKLIAIFFFLYPAVIYSYQYVGLDPDFGPYPGFNSTQTYSYMFPFLGGILYLCGRHYRASRHLPVQRAQILWLILAWTIGPSLYLILRGIPVLLGLQPLLDNSLAMNSIISTTYLMVLIGIARLDLFQLERHIGQAYRWVLVPLCFFGLDFALVAFVNLSPSISSIIVLGIVLWVYLPIRQWLHQRYSENHLNKGQILLNESLVQMVHDSLDTNSTPAKTWKSVNELVFKPGMVTNLNGEMETSVAELGQQLVVTGNTYSPPLLLEFADGGNRLFNNRDLALATTLTLLFEKLYDVRDAYLAGQTQERNRIRRELHDQIGHKLLSLIYTAQDSNSRSLAQETMAQLSEVIQALKQEPISLDDLAVRIHTLSSDTCRHAGLKLEWNNEIRPDNDIEINSEQYLNILNIVRELLSNTVKHSNASTLGIALDYSENILTVNYTDNGTGFSQAEVKPGNGLFSMQLRATELKASMEWRTEEELCVRLDIPLATGEAENE